MRTVVHCKKHNNDDPNYVYCGRPSYWGNPFVMSGNSTRKQVIDKYIAHLHDNPSLLANISKFLPNKILGCWCSPAPCHCDVLATLADYKLDKCVIYNNEYCFYNNNYDEYIVFDVTDTKVSYELIWYEDCIYQITKTKEPVNQYD